MLNLPPHKLSRVSSIFLLATINCLNLGSSSVDRAIYPVMKNIIGANERLNAKGYKIEIGYFAGDTPISQAFCGLVEAVGNANYPCRQCYVHKSEILTTFQNTYTPRQMHESFSLKDASNPKGVTNIPLFLSLDLIDPIQQTPMDIMHIIPEGVCRKQVKKILDAWTTTKRTTWDELRACIDNFSYGYLHADNRIKNFSPHDLKKKELITSASQMLSLVLLFPYIFQNIVDITHEEYKYDFFIYLLKF